MTLPCTAQCNIEISQGGIASAPASQRAIAFAALTANIPAAGGRGHSLSLFPKPPLPTAQTVLCAFQQASVPMCSTLPQDFQGNTRSYPPLLQEALRARFTLACKIEHRGQGSSVDAPETCILAAQNANRGRHAGTTQAMAVGGHAGLPLESFVKPHVDHTHRACEL
jgi:hypothetical protein